MDVQKKAIVKCRGKTQWSDVDMVIEKGNKVHISYRPLYENSVRRHFLGEVQANEGSICRLEGFEFIYDQKSTKYLRKPEKRITIIDLSENGYVVNIIDSEVNLVDVVYKYVMDVGLIVTDGKEFSLNINEFGTRS